MNIKNLLSIKNILRLKTPARSDGEYHKFAKDIIWIGGGQVFTSIILGIIALPILTKYYTPEIFGIWIQVNVTIELMAPIVSLQLGLAAVKFLAGQEDAIKRRRFLGSMLFVISIFACFLSLAAIPFAKQLSVLLFASPAYINLLWIVLIWIYINTMYNFFLSYLQARSKNKEISVIQITTTIAKVTFILGLAISGANIELIVISQIVLQTAFSILIFILVKKEMGFPAPNLRGLTTFLAYSIPQVPGVILLWVIRMSDRYFITHFLSLSQDGIYSSSVTLANLVSLFFVPVSWVLFALTARLWEQKRFDDAKSYVDYSLKLYLTLAIPGAVGISILSQPLLKLLTTSEFLAGEELVFLVTFGMLFFGIFLMNINLILLDKRAKLVPLITAIGSIINVAMNITLIPHMGIMGAGLSSLASYFAIALIATIITRRIIHYNLNFIYHSKVVISTLVMLICLYFLKVDDIWSIILAVFVGLIVYGAGLILLRSFSDRDKQLFKKIITNLIPVRPSEEK